jgi:serine/threonine protein phosphatase PrpC
MNRVEILLNRAEKGRPGHVFLPERSGSCATVILIVDRIFYVVNVGDSRCIMSVDAG